MKEEIVMILNKSMEIILFSYMIMYSFRSKFYAIQAKDKSTKPP